MTHSLETLASQHNSPERLSPSWQQLTTEEETFIRTLEPNFGPTVLAQNNIDPSKLPAFYYGTLMNGQTADGYLDGAVTDHTETAVLEGYDEYFHQRAVVIDYGDGPALRTEQFPYALKTTSENPTNVQGRLYFFKEVTDDGQPWTDRLQQIDGYEELDRGFYERQIVLVRLEDGTHAYAMAYIATDKLPSRTYRMPEANIDQLPIYGSRTDPKIPSGNFVQFKAELDGLRLARLGGKTIPTEEPK